MEVENNASTFSRQVGILFSKDGERCEVFLGNKPVILKHLDKGQFSNEFAKKQFVLRLENDKWHLLINDTIRFIELAK
jgi:hypothetical protein